MEERFIKVSLTKKEKMNLLLFDLLPERILKKEIVYKYNKDKSINVIEEPKQEFEPVICDDDDCVMPFFDNIDDDTESNF